MACSLAIARRWLSSSRITLVFQQYFKYHAAELQRTLSRLFSNVPSGAITHCSFY